MPIDCSDAGGIQRGGEVPKIGRKDLSTGTPMVHGSKIASIHSFKVNLSRTSGEKKFFFNSFVLFIRQNLIHLFGN